LYEFCSGVFAWGDGGVDAESHIPGVCAWAGAMYRRPIGERGLRTEQTVHHFPTDISVPCRTWANPSTRAALTPSAMEEDMSNSEHTDPLIDRPRTPDELRRLYLEQDRAGGAMWPWIASIAAVIFVVTLVYGYKTPNSNTAGPAPAAANVSPLAATPTPVPAAPAPPTDMPH